MPGKIVQLPTNAITTAPETLPWATQGTTLPPNLSQEQTGWQPYGVGPPPDYRLENYARLTQSTLNERDNQAAIFTEYCFAQVDVTGVAAGVNQRRVTINGVNVDYTDQPGDTEDLVKAAFAALINANPVLLQVVKASSSPANPLSIVGLTPGTVFTLAVSVLAGAGTITTTWVPVQPIMRTDDDYHALDLVVGSPSADDDGNPLHDKRIVWRKDIAAFRAGEATGTQWDLASCGLNSTATGFDCQASGQSAVAMGEGCLASAQAAISVGQNCVASDSTAIAMGGTSTASAQAAVAIGAGCTASGIGAIAVGSAATATKQNAVALGVGVATGIGSVAIGGQGFTTAYAVEDDDVAIGTSASANNGGGAGTGAFAAGYNATASASAALALGDYATASASEASALSRGTASAAGALAHGRGSTASGAGAVALGATTAGNTLVASGDGSLATGRAAVINGVVASAQGAIAHGAPEQSWANNAVTASGKHSLAQGEGVTASADFSQATGYGAKATNRGEVAHANYDDTGAITNGHGRHQTGFAMAQVRVAAAAALTQLCPDSITGGGAATWTPIDDRGYAVRVQAVAKSESSAKARCWDFQIVVAKDAGATALAANGVTMVAGAPALANVAAVTNIPPVADVGGWAFGASGPDLQISAVGGDIILKASGDATVACRITAKIEYTQAGLDY